MCRSLTLNDDWINQELSSICPENVDKYQNGLDYERPVVMKYGGRIQKNAIGT